jgi:hypothetical protein
MKEEKIKYPPGWLEKCVEKWEKEDDSEEEVPKDLEDLVTEEEKIKWEKCGGEEHILILPRMKEEKTKSDIEEAIL